MNNRDDLGNIHSITPKHLCTEVKSQAPSYSFMPWSRCQPHGFILSWRNIPDNRVGRFYSMFVWIWRGMGAFLREPLALLCFPRGVRWGLRAPKPAPKSQMWKPHCGLSGLSSCGSRQSTSLPNLAITAILEPTRPRPAAPGYTERPARVQFMLGRVGLYSDDLNACQRPDSKRPQALKSRVACAKRCGSRTAVLHGFDFLLVIDLTRFGYYNNRWKRKGIKRKKKECVPQ